MPTRGYSRWLADRRDPAPLYEREWIGQKNFTKDWRLEITINDFLDGILFERKGETWINVYGSWEEGDTGREESFYLTSALVLPTASQSLLNALSTCPDPNDYKLPSYQEEGMEFEIPPFVLTGWIWREDTNIRLDEFDPFAGPIDFPPYHIGQLIMEKMGLRSDSEERNWYLPDKEKESIVCELWSTNKSGRDREPLRRGRKLSVSLEFLKVLCSTMKRDLIVEVQLNRRFKRESYMKDEDRDGYTPPLSKVFIISANGKLRTTETYYQLRESPG